MWTAFPLCYKENFVNCVFKMEGECQNPRHQKSGPSSSADEPPKKGVGRKKFIPAPLPEVNEYLREWWE